jgi:tRNA-specific 2-thiouridylase
MNKRAIIAMSGGVDSSVAAALMLEQGYECIGITLKLFDNGDILPPEDSRGAGTASPQGDCCAGAVSPHRDCCSRTAPPYRGCCSLADVNDARDVAYRLNMPHYVLNFSDVFTERVIRRFIETYEKGATPNPCIDCNRYIKFESLLLRARQLDFDYIVTGHYARIEKRDGRYLLKKALDPKKDQSYVLYAMTQEQLAHTQFPLGGMTKSRVRETALACGFVNAEKQDSQDICFVPDGNYGDFIEGYTGKHHEPGNIIDREGRVLGRHRGLIRYTIGQRRGLGLSFPVPMYVAAKSVAANTLTLGPEESLYAKTLIADNLNLIACERLDKPLRVMVKTRYLQQEQGALAEQLDADTLRLSFDEPQRALTPGQAAVLYQEDLVVGGGTITETG